MQKGFLILLLLCVSLSTAEAQNRSFYPVKKEKKKSKKEKKADVFFVYPTLLTDKKIKDWNANIWSSSVRQDVFQTAVKYPVCNKHHPGGAAGGVYRKCCILQEFAYTPRNGLHQKFSYFF